MIHLTRRLLSRLLWLGLFGLILIAALMTALRLALPLTDHYRTEVVQALSERLGYPLRVETLTLRLAGWTPRVVLGGAVIACPETGNDLLRLHALELDLDAIATLRSHKPQIRALTMVGARLVIRRAADGRLGLIGLGALQTDDPTMLALFLQQGRLNLTDSEVLIIDDGLGGAVFRLAEVRLRLHNAGQMHQLELLARPPGAPAATARLRLLADLRGDSEDLTHWTGAIYLQAQDADLGALLPWTPLDPDLLRGEGLALESWNQLRAGALVESTSRIAARTLTLGVPSPPDSRVSAARPTAASVPDDAAARPPDPAPSPVPVSVERLTGLIRVTAEPEGWRLAVADLGLAVDGAEITDVDLDLRLSAGGSPRSLDLAAAAFDLQAAQRLFLAVADQVPLTSGSATDLIHALRPRGRIDQLAARVAFPSRGPPSWHAAVLARGVGIDRHGRIPGVDGLNARLRADQDGGEGQLDSTALDLDLRPLFDPSLHLDHVSGTLKWTPGPGGALQLQGLDLEMENADLAGRGRFVLDLPAPRVDADGATSPFLDLRATLYDADGSQVRRYLPVGVMKPKLIQWLTGALVAGRVSQADVLLRGPLTRYPFRGQEGRFELLLNYSDLVLDYQVGWPRIEAATGGLHFLNQGLEIWMDAGRIYDTSLTQGRAAIPDLWDLHWMPIHGEGSGPFADGLRILAETPLANHLGPLARVLEVQGRSRLVLDLDLPLFAGGTMGVAGSLSWPEPAGVALKGTPLALTGLGGDLGFTINSLTAESIRGQLWGRPATLAISTKGADDPLTASTQITARSRQPVTELAARLPSNAWRLAAGELALDLSLDLRNADLKDPHLPLNLRLQSDLRGLALDLPPPLGKGADRARPLELTGALVPGRSLTMIGGMDGLGLDLALDLAAPGTRLQQGRVTLGTARNEPRPGAGPEPRQAAGLVIDGVLAELNLPAWTDWWGRVAPRLGAKGERRADPGLDPLSVDLRIATLDLGGARLTDARVQAAPAADGWDLRIAAQELAGQVLLPTAGPWDIDLDRLDLKALVPPAQDSDLPAAPAAPTRHLPAADLQVADLRWGEARLGRLELEVRPAEDGFHCPRLEFDGLGDTRVTGNAHWIDSPTGGRSRLALGLKSADTGPLLRALDFSAALSAAPVDVRLRLDWPGKFAAFALARAAGQIELDVGPGRLLEVDPGVGRVLGFLNLGELGRRLTLDFSDLYEEGFVFESIEGRIAVADGQARLKTFAIDGPASDIRVSGFADLRARTFDQTVTVEPSIGTSVALASGMAGGPVVGAAVYLLDRLSGGALDRLGSYQYRMTGPWAKPEFTRIGWEPFPRGAASGKANAGTTAPPGEQGAGVVRPAASPPPSRPAAGSHFLEGH